MCRDPRSRLSLVENVGRRKGLAQFFTLNCSVCLNVTEFCSSKRSEKLVSCPFDVNTRSVHASLTEGLGHSGLTKICASFDLPRPSGNRPFNVILKRLSKNSENIAEHKMKEAAERLIEMVKSESPDQIENLPDGNVVANVSVTVDGTWQGSGYGSKSGVVFVISVRTGEILGYVVKPNIAMNVLVTTKMTEPTKHFYIGKLNTKINAALVILVHLVAWKRKVQFRYFFNLLRRGI